MDNKKAGAKLLNQGKANFWFWKEQAIFRQ
jgi:hypothetical protein